MEKADITTELVSRLVAAQFPRWAGLAVRPARPGGWDNVTFRLGPGLSVLLVDLRPPGRDANLGRQSGFEAIEELGP